MAKERVNLGRRGEQISAAALSSRGFSIVERNWHCPEGEVDLVATREGAWYFIEVRTRRGDHFGSPEESITERKQARMEEVARAYLGSGKVHADDPSWHVSFIAVKLGYNANVQRLDFYPTLLADPIDLLERAV